MQENFIIHPRHSKLASEIRNTLRDFDNQGEYVVEGARNTIKKVNIEGLDLNIKSFKVPNAFQALVYKYIRKSKAKRSFEYATKLLDCEISTPFPIAYLEEFGLGLKESYYISKHLDYDFDFRKLIHNPKFPMREEILKQFTRFCFQLHENNVNFLDHSPGNTLIIDKGDGKYEFYLIDLNRIKFEPLNFDQRMHNLRRLWLSKTMIKIIAREYAQLYGKTYEETHALLLKHSKRFQDRLNLKKLRRRR